MKKQFNKTYDEIISLENLLAAWREFIPGKRAKRDVQEFSLRLADHLVQLHSELANFTYEHGGYHAFNISDPKPRNIHKAAVRDRILHHAIYRQLYPFFDRTFIADSFSCRLNRGVHKALNRLREFGRKAGSNNTKTVWVLKLDIKRFFASIDHANLLKILVAYIPDKNILWLLEQIVLSFPRKRESMLWIPDQVGNDIGRGLPLGNLTSQLFCNVYLNELDQFVKHGLKAKYYIRYADDFVLLSENREWLADQISKISGFLERRLCLSLHPDKIILKPLASGVDFLGWVHFPHHRVLRAATKRRAFRKICDHPINETLQSYLGLLSHGNSFKLRQEILNWQGLWLGEE